ncbi:uncharacterized protein A4U43_C08F15530 [Asparagus officinalis]|uniref:uncharacterized protein LOC109819998 n=1 Tax=Asparagus officinalis TaxID=4686 RepID=UPI00098E4903|nr:uncharacterized protein LOC109819998 [Asparagus officinalis]ONK60208.1 uncharacterized protein A4U43_C08F15530 [Asparagus officinalis]
MASHSVISPLEPMSKESLIAQTEKDMFKALEEMKSTLTDQVFMEIDIHDVIKTVAEGIEKNKIADTEVVPILWDALMDTILYIDGREDPVLIEWLVWQRVLSWSQLLSVFCITEECELELLKQVHRRSIKEQRLQGSFEEVVDILYTNDVLTARTIHNWFYYHISEVDREEAFVKDLKPVVDSMEKKMLELALPRA